MLVVGWLIMWQLRQEKVTTIVGQQPSARVLLDMFETGDGSSSSLGDF